METVDAGTTGICSQVNSAHCERWRTEWRNCKMRSIVYLGVGGPGHHVHRT